MASGSGGTATVGRRGPCISPAGPWKSAGRRDVKRSIVAREFAEAQCRHVIAFGLEVVGIGSSPVGAMVLGAALDVGKVGVKTPGQTG